MGREALTLLESKSHAPVHPTPALLFSFSSLFIYFFYTHQWTQIITVYTILLGDFGTFERDDFFTFFSVLLFVLFSFMVVIVLLNVLIAIVSDSYEKCLLRSQLLFGRARVMLLAELVSFQNLLRNYDEDRSGVNGSSLILGHCRKKKRFKGCTQGGIIFYLLSVTVILLLFIAETAGYASGHHYGTIRFSFFSILVNVFIFVVITVFLSWGPGGMTDSSRCSGSCWYTNSIEKIMLGLLGTSEETSFAANDVEEWKGRIHYLKGEMTRIAAESNLLMKSGVKALDIEVRSIRGEVISLEGHILRNVTAEIRASEARIEEIVRSAVREMDMARGNNENKASCKASI